ncbi:MAG: DNA gyrase inhibitor YacG [Gammaproteobacteria bacterium HGW-Gammaproteobacteria-11]|nr:MAG: DNA gyrase inhibitor YacG [Gammaproteobacteria bacterium HGW-Gammaproteobacteria-11]
MTLSVECPTCKAPVNWNDESPDRPFCSPRCRLIDLGAWASEEHAIPGEELEQDIFSDDLPPQ